MYKKMFLITLFFAILISLVFFFLTKKLINKPQMKVIKPIYTPTKNTQYPTYNPVTLNPSQVVEINKQATNDIEFNTGINEYQKNTPLLYLMPVKEQNFMIEYLGESLYKVTLYGDKIDSKQKAVKWWNNKKVDPTKLNIQWE